MVRITANGKPYDVPEGMGLLGFLERLNLKPQWVVVELNGEPLERENYAQITLSQGDRLEIVRAVAGG